MAGGGPLTRRRFLGSALVCSAPLGLSGCTLFRRPLEERCSYDPSISNPDTDLTVDMHVHVFNATDVPVRAFFEHVLSRDATYAKAYKLLSPILQQIGWTVAPDANTELERLALVEDALRSCSTEGFNTLLAFDRQEGHSIGLNALQSALRKTPGYQAELRKFDSKTRSSRSAKGSVVEQILSIPPNVGDYRKTLKRTQKYVLGDVEIKSTLDFVLQVFQYRYVNVFNYLDDYARNPKRSVDLMVCHLVDYDWPIAEGKPTKTSFKAQNEVMGRISVLTGGRVHCFAAFDPFKQVAFRRGLTSESPLKLLQEAVDRHGFIGAKLYPPMGFAPYGNAQLQIDHANFWNNPSWFPPEMNTPDLGVKLDEVLSELYEWCVNNDVPVMAHTNVSLGPSTPFMRLATAEYWAKALDKYRDLRVSFGHFGDTDVVEGTQAGRAEDYSRLMTQGPDTPGEHAYADSAFFAESLSQPYAVRERLRSLLKLTRRKGNAALSRRLMYGTDWEMLTRLSDPYSKYLNRFVDIISELNEDPSISESGRFEDQFFGLNAAELLGLRRDQPARKRLDAFYSQHRMAPPMWASKLDARPA